MILKTNMKRHCGQLHHKKRMKAETFLNNVRFLSWRDTRPTLKLVLSGWSDGEIFFLSISERGKMNSKI